jgi:TonB-dependent starch-binding outer membrane protein SusC
LYIIYKRLINPKTNSMTEISTLNEAIGFRVRPQPIIRMIGISLFILCTFSAFAQSPVTGTVKDDQGQPLPGVNVLHKGTTNGTTTDADGRYSISVPADASLIFSFIGYASQEVSVGNKSVIDVDLQTDIASLDEIVVIGYGTQKREDLTGSIASVNTEALNKVATNDVTKALQGQVAGVSVHSGGEPGAAPQIKIRGVSSFNNNTPLYIIDGIQSPINDVPTADIESIDILKDASAAAIYGSRAANGVVIITTKRGKGGKLRVDYNGYYGVQRIANRYDVANREQYQLLVNEASVNAGVPILPANDSNNATYFVDDVDTDWQEEAFKAGRIQEHTLSLSGGNDNGTYNFSLNNFDHSGTIEGKGPSYNRLSFRVNSDFKSGKFKFGESMNYTKIDQDFMTFLHTGTSLIYIVNAIPTLPVYDPTTIDGYSSSSQTIHGSYTANAIGFNNLISSNTERYRFTGNVYGEYEIIDGLKYRASLSYERTDWRDFYFQPVHNLGWFYVNNIAKMNDWRGSGNTGTIENTLTYAKTIGKHDFSVLAGNTIWQSSINRIQGHAEGFSQPYFPVLSQGTSGISVTGYEELNRMLSYFGRLIYNYNDKYLLTATIRRDASSRFAVNHRWGTFPSIGVGWKIHNEDFMRAVPFVSQLKLTGSYGVLGNQEIPPYQYEAFLNPYSHAVFSNQLAVGATQVEFATPDIRWESKKSANVGITLGLFEDKINFSAEYYSNTSEDMLIRVRIPESTGVYPWKSPYVNGASVRNSGFEFQLGYQDTKGDFSYSFNANFSTLKNEVLSLGYGDKPIYGGISKTEVGGEVGQLYGWVIEDIFQSQDEIDELNAASPIGRYQEALTAPGDFKYKDINGRGADGKLTGQPDGKIDDDDRAYLGSAIPKVYFGFNIKLNYKAFDFTLLASGVSGNKIFNGLRSAIENGAGWDNYSSDMMNRWTPENTDTDVPRVVMYDPNKNGRASSRWLEDGSYLKLTTVQFGYTVPTTVLSKIKLARARVYVTGQNLYTFTKYTGYDPDFGSDGLFDRAIDQASYPNKPFTAFAGGLPNPRTILVGVQIGL